MAYPLIMTMRRRREGTPPPTYLSWGQDNEVETETIGCLRERLFLTSCSMDMTQVENPFRVHTKMPHVWPESIDMDRFENIYFTDAAEGTLYRIRRNKDNSLDQKEETLLKDFKRASGISIDPIGQVLYMGGHDQIPGKNSIQNSRHSSRIFQYLPGISISL